VRCNVDSKAAGWCMIFASAITSGHLPTRYTTAFALPHLCVNPSLPPVTLLSSLLPSLASCNPLRSAGACAFPTFWRTFRVYELLIGYRPFLFFPQRHPRGSIRARIGGLRTSADCQLYPFYQEHPGEINSATYVTIRTSRKERRYGIDRKKDKKEKELVR